MEKAKENKGVTLITLAISIIVIMILTFSSAFAGYSLVKYTRYMSAKTQMEIMQNYVDELYRKGEGYTNGVAITKTQYNLDSANADFLGALGKTDEYVYTEDQIEAGIAGDNPKVTDYRLYTSEYITYVLGIEGIEYDFLISVKYRDVRLAYGIEYQYNETTGDNYYYTTKDFGIERIRENPISSVSYDSFIYNSNDKQLEITNIVFYDSNNNIVPVSKFIIEYTGNDNWSQKLITKIEDEYIIPLEISGNVVPKMRIKDTSGNTIAFKE